MIIGIARRKVLEASARMKIKLASREDRDTVVVHRFHAQKVGTTTYIFAGKNADYQFLNSLAKLYENIFIPNAILFRCDFSGKMRLVARLCGNILPGFEGKMPECE